MTISRFFAPRKSSVSKKTAETKVLVGEDGWEKPIGLTKKYAITIEDTSSDEHDDAQDQQDPDPNQNQRTPRSSLCKGVVLESTCSLGAQVHATIEAIHIGVNDSEKEKAETLPKTYVGDENINEPESVLSKSNTLRTCELSGTVVTADKPPEEDPETQDSDENMSKEEKIGTDGGKAEETVENKVHSNPFLQFAYDIGGCESSYLTSLSTSSKACADSCSNDTIRERREVSQKRLKQNVPITRRGRKLNSSPSISSDGGCDKAKSKVAKKRKRKFEKVDENDIEYTQMTQDQLAKCRSKWQSFADESAPLEIKRFQVLIAARLHCQAHESTVRKAMINLRNLFSDQDGSISGENATTSNGGKGSPEYLCPNSLSTASPEQISKIISSVLFANVKSKQIIQAAKEIKTRFRGKVPETKKGMQMITGIGPKLAELLFYVNSIAAYSVANEEGINQKTIAHENLSSL